MTKKQKANAVLVAQDVLKQLRRKSVPLNVAKGYYMSFPNGDGPSDQDDGDLQACVDDIQKRCGVCARGALVLSKARLFDEVPLYYLNNLQQWDTSQLLEDVWDEKQLCLIESAFELGKFECYGLSEKLVYGAIVFGAQFPDSKKRLKAIMENVIENDGVFTVAKGMADEANRDAESVIFYFDDIVA